MAKHLSAVQFNGMTFGMDVDTDTEAWKKFKKAVKTEDCISVFGDTKISCLTVPYIALAAIMREAHWLVSERKLFDKITIEGLKGGELIYVKYSDEPINFKIRRQQRG